MNFFFVLKPLDKCNTCICDSNLNIFTITEKTKGRNYANVCIYSNFVVKMGQTGKFPK